MPESKRHLELRTALYLIVKLAFADRAVVGSDQFVYWNAADPRRRLAPDVFVRKGGPDRVFSSWKIWQWGAPELAVEIVSESERPELEWDEKLGRYREAGIEELVRFDPEAEPGARLRVWDRLEADLVERVVEGETTPCAALERWWVVREHAELGSVLRLAEDAAGERLLPTPDEARERAEQRVAELEAELRNLRG
ncbi:MAG: Uma2 family endonuclease [Deltaproteobacteria bacterium]|nr:Uma2 family endonuclease [Deltaproteobacteria bacterium]